MSEQDLWITGWTGLENAQDWTDWEIDQMVYALYELTEEEIKIVEGQ